MNYFQIDDGYALVGDWEDVLEDRFPDHGAQNGIEWLLDRAKTLGFQTGLWIEAFNARDNAQIFLNHPEWFVDPMMFGLIGGDPPSLDMTNPDVQDHLQGLMEMYLDWGVQWIKLDFAYLAPLSEGWYEPNTTRGEFYRAGVKVMRETLGEDVFFLNVAITGWNVGLVDSIRLTLDTMPSWEGENPGALIDNQGLKPMYRDSIRKYWMHNRLWINHPDLIFYRAHRDTNIPALTLNESNAFSTSFALQGGLVKIGDRIVDLEPDHVAGYRTILPIYGQASRPLDLFEREFPEVFSMPIKDFDEPYHVIGLINWGTNTDLTVVPFSHIPEADRPYTVDLQLAGLDPTATYHAYEYWTESYLGTVTGTLVYDVPARHPRVIALWPAKDRPMYLGTNRHVLNGIKVVDSLVWNNTSLTLTGVQEGSVGTAFEPFSFHLAYYVPSGYAFDEVEFDFPPEINVTNVATNLTPSGSGELLDIEFTVEETVVPPEGAQFEKVTWDVKFTNADD